MYKLVETGECRFGDYSIFELPTNFRVIIKHKNNPGQETCLGGFPTLERAAIWLLQL